MIKKLSVAALLLCLLPACPRTPDATTKPPIDPYATARTIILGTQLVVALSDGAFEIAASFLAPDKVPAARGTFVKIKTSVVDGLKVALDAVAVAESQKQGFDLAKLMAPAEAAYQSLIKFILSLKAPAASAPAATPPSTPLPPSLLGH